MQWNWGPTPQRSHLLDRGANETMRSSASISCANGRKSLVTITRGHRTALGAFVVAVAHPGLCMPRYTRQVRTLVAHGRVKQVSPGRCQAHPVDAVREQAEFTSWLHPGR